MFGVRDCNMSSTIFFFITGIFILKSSKCWDLGELDCPEWWETALIYELEPLSFQDSNNDGFGDLQGIINRLKYFQYLEVDAICLGPIFPWRNSTFNVMDHKQIDPLLGDFDVFQELVDQAHSYGIKVILEIMPYHTSDDHPWFKRWKINLSPFEDSYVAYMLEFWLSTRVDGFRIIGLPHYTNSPLLERNVRYLYEIRKVVDEWTKQRNATSKYLVAETSEPEQQWCKYYGTADSPGVLPLNNLLTSIDSNAIGSVSATKLKTDIENRLNAVPSNATTNWMLSNRDDPRIASRVGYDNLDTYVMLSMLLPGQAYTYFGDEIGMEDYLSDTCINSYKHAMQWENYPGAGFTTNTSRGSIPINQNFASVNVKDQKYDAQSHLRIYKQLAELRKHPVFRRGSWELKTLSDDAVLVLGRDLPGSFDIYLVVLNVAPVQTNVNLTELNWDLDELLSVNVSSYTNACGRVHRDSLDMPPTSGIVLTSRATRKVGGGEEDRKGEVVRSGKKTETTEYVEVETEPCDREDRHSKNNEGEHSIPQQDRMQDKNPEMRKDRENFGPFRESCKDGENGNVGDSMKEGKEEFVRETTECEHVRSGEKTEATEREEVETETVDREDRASECNEGEHSIQDRMQDENPEIRKNRENFGPFRESCKDGENGNVGDSIKEGKEEFVRETTESEHVRSGDKTEATEREEVETVMVDGEDRASKCNESEDRMQNDNRDIREEGENEDVRKSRKDIKEGDVGEIRKDREDGAVRESHKDGENGNVRESIKDGKEGYVREITKGEDVRSGEKTEAAKYKEVETEPDDREDRISKSNEGEDSIQDRMQDDTGEIRKDGENGDVRESRKAIREGGLGEIRNDTEDGAVRESRKDGENGNVGESIKDGKEGYVREITKGEDVRSGEKTEAAKYKEVETEPADREDRISKSNEGEDSIQDRMQDDTGEIRKDGENGDVRESRKAIREGGLGEIRNDTEDGAVRESRKDGENGNVGESIKDGKEGYVREITKGEDVRSGEKTEAAKYKEVETEPADREDRISKSNEGEDSIQDRMQDDTGEIRKDGENGDVRESRKAIREGGLGEIRNDTEDGAVRESRKDGENGNVGESIKDGKEGYVREITKGEDVRSGEKTDAAKYKEVETEPDDREDRISKRNEGEDSIQDRVQDDTGKIRKDGENGDVRENRKDREDTAGHGDGDARVDGKDKEDGEVVKEGKGKNPTVQKVEEGGRHIRRKNLRIWEKVTPKDFFRKFVRTLIARKL